MERRPTLPRAAYGLRMPYTPARHATPSSAAAGPLPTRALRPRLGRAEVETK